MAYKGLAKKLLDKFGVEEGDWIAFDTREGHFEGALMPRPESSSENCLVVKLASGYNVGIEITGSEEIIKKKASKQLSAFKKKMFCFKEGKPLLSLIHTGGTIGSKVDYKTGGVSALMSPKDVLATAPKIKEITNLKNVVSPFTIDSADMTSQEWQKIASLVAKELNSGAQGVVVTHGTDTLHYTAAALAFMLQNLDSPVVLVGAQRSPDRGSFDGAMNLYCAACVAASDYAGVAIVMHESSNDDFCAILPATKSRKMHSSRRDAFKAINVLPLGRVSSNGEITWLREDVKKSLKNTRENAGKNNAGAGEVKADTRFEKKIGLLKAHPNADPALLDFLVDKGVRGV
ncbi:MAG: Glu-tRNA(Gln) amidotransferase subunit GatD, partial [Candidatus Norongarragalinales archaeon]